MKSGFMSVQVSCCTIVKKSHHTTDGVLGMFLLAYISITHTHERARVSALSAVIAAGCTEI